MDEPLSNLDAKLRAAMRTELKTIHQATQATSLYVTHDQSEAMSMADRIVVMREGEVVQVGTPEEVYFQSANTFVASFIGMPPTNFLDVEIVREADAVSLVHPRFRLPLDAPQAARLAAYGRRALTLGVRPEDLLLVDAEEAVLTETVQVAEPQGSHQVVSADLAGTLLKIVAPAQPTLHAGDPLPLTVRTERLQFFDSESGERLRQA
jgi:multiple sugar transport system ATP-binding protein